MNGMAIYEMVERWQEAVMASVRYMPAICMKGLQNSVHVWEGFYLRSVFGICHGSEPGKCERSSSKKRYPS
jgi:hypothetical protein